MKVYTGHFIVINYHNLYNKEVWNNIIFLLYN